jgi:peptidoglycan hydrolase-like protein with peptidoglycan-binding domain
MTMRARPGLVAMAMSFALVTAACGNGGSATPTTSTSADPVAAAQARVDAARTAVTGAESALTGAHQDFCGTAKGYVETLDRYGRVFTDRAATVGDVQTLGADLIEPRAEVTTSVDAVQTAKTSLAAAQQELVDAEVALATAVNEAAAASGGSASPSVQDSLQSPTPTTVTTPTLVPAASIDRVKQAEQDLAQTAKGINSATTLVDAGAAYNSAALALEIAWLNLLGDAGCFSDERQAEAAAKLNAYTLALQTDLKRAGYDPGPIDGIYGPQTVAAVQQLQRDSGLAVTGFVDEATARALQAKLAAVGQQEAAQSAAQTAALQAVLKLMGYWDGPVDGQWTDALTLALKKAQAALGVEPTGVVDPATLVAFQAALAALEALSTAAPATVTATETATATETRTATATETATQTKTATETATETTTAKSKVTVETTTPDKTTG